MHTIARAFSVIAALCVSGGVMAEDAAAPAQTASSVPTMNCPQPKLPERVSIPQEDIQYLMEQIRTYTDCVRKYVEARQEAANRYNALVKAEADAGNAAVKEINEYHAQVLAFRDKHDPAKQ